MVSTAIFQVIGGSLCWPSSACCNNTEYATLTYTNVGVVSGGVCMPEQISSAFFQIRTAAGLDLEDAASAPDTVG